MGFLQSASACVAFESSSQVGVVMRRKAVVRRSMYRRRHDASFAVSHTGGERDLEEPILASLFGQLELELLPFHPEPDAALASILLIGHTEPDYLVCMTSLHRQSPCFPTS